jgi:hypothetical protein
MNYGAKWVVGRAAMTSLLDRDEAKLTILSRIQRADSSNIPNIFYIKLPNKWRAHEIYERAFKLFLCSFISKALLSGNANKKPRDSRDV